MKIKLAFREAKYSFISLLVGLILVVTLAPTVALADRSLTMEQIMVDAQVLPDASMLVTEHITVDFSGRWEGFFVKIPQGDTPIVDVVVSENGQAYEFNPGTDYGPPGTYLTKLEGNDILIDWSIDTYGGKRIFDVSYRVINAVKIHNDVAELYRKFIGEANGNKIGYVDVAITLPDGAEQYVQGEDIRIWGHGPLNGEVQFDGPSGVALWVNDLPAYTFMEARVVMPKDLFYSAPLEAFTGKEALNSILSEEQGWADKANQERMMAKAEIGVAGGIVALGLGGIFILWTRYGRRHKPSFDGDYYRDLPTNYSPAELSVLWNFNKMQAQDITATILDLARRNFLFLEEDTVQVRKLLGSKEVNTFLVSFLPPPEPAMLRKPEEAVLRPHEQELIEFLRDEIGAGNNYIYLTDIENYAKKKGVYFHDFWEGWTSGITANCERYDFFDSRGNMPLFTMLAGLVLAGGGLAAAANIGIIGYALMIVGGLILFIPRLFWRRSANGEEDYAKWAAFKKFLEHFSEMQRHEIPSLIIWEHYLVYAVTLGVAKQVISQLEIVFPNMEEGGYKFGSGWMMYGNYMGISSLNNSFEGLSSSFERSLQTASKAASKASSGSGGGGGFSGGGGGGGGGGSYGGR